MNRHKKRKQTERRKREKEREVEREGGRKKSREGKELEGPSDGLQLVIVAAGRCSPCMRRRGHETRVMSLFHEAFFLKKAKKNRKPAISLLASLK